MVFHFYTTSTCVTPYKCPSPSIMFDFICIIFFCLVLMIILIVFILTITRECTLLRLKKSTCSLHWPSLYQSSCKVIHNWLPLSTLFFFFFFFTLHKCYFIICPFHPLMYYILQCLTKLYSPFLVVAFLLFFWLFPVQQHLFPTTQPRALLTSVKVFRALLLLSTPFVFLLF